uniref:Uncharacterized protein n=1 Tax=Arundo donax TaxID=35708 RepID=A0A0A8XWR6_ARUDO
METMQGCVSGTCYDMDETDLEWNARVIAELAILHFSPVCVVMSSIVITSRHISNPVLVSRPLVADVGAANQLSPKSEFNLLGDNGLETANTAPVTY